MTNAQRGAYWKARTRRWLEANGWQVADLEVVRYVGPKRIPVKRDQMASDLLAVHPEHGLAFVQVKGGAQCLGKGTFPAARRAFESFRWPDLRLVGMAVLSSGAPIGLRRWIVAWAPRARQPRVIEC